MLLLELNRPEILSDLLLIQTALFLKLKRKLQTASFITFKIFLLQTLQIEFVP